MSAAGQHPPPPPPPTAAQWTEPPWSGWIETTGDALLILEAARQGLIPRVTRRLVEAERRMITSGSVFVFDEDESHIKRWTDGFFWSPSRILGNFLLYRETEKRGAGHRAARADDAEPNDATLSRPRADGAPPGIDRQRERTLMGSLTNTYKFKPDGLMKKTFSVTIGGVAQHLISYYKIADVETGRLRPPSSLPELAALDISPEYLDKTHFRNPPKVEVGADGVPRYRGEADDADAPSPSPPLAPTTSTTLLSDPAQGPKRKRPDDPPHAKRARRDTVSSSAGTPTADPGSPPGSAGSATPQPVPASAPAPAPIAPSPPTAHPGTPTPTAAAAPPSHLPPPPPPPGVYPPYGFFPYPHPQAPPMYAPAPPPAQTHGMGPYAPPGSPVPGPGPGYAPYPQYAPHPHAHAHAHPMQPAHAHRTDPSQAAAAAAPPGVPSAGVGPAPGYYYAPPPPLPQNMGGASGGYGTPYQWPMYSGYPPQAVAHAPPGPAVGQQVQQGQQQGLTQQQQQQQPPPRTDTTRTA